MENLIENDSEDKITSEQNVLIIMIIKLIILLTNFIYV